MKLKPAISLEKKNTRKHSTIKAIISKTLQKSSNCPNLFTPVPSMCILQHQTFALKWLTY